MFVRAIDVDYYIKHTHTFKLQKHEWLERKRKLAFSPTIAHGRTCEHGLKLFIIECALTCEHGRLPLRLLCSVARGLRRDLPSHHLVGGECRVRGP